jgi:gamma-glutamyltranspeptidase/glutathione hydrolase
MSSRAGRWMVATSHPLAVDAALDIMEQGGNAADAAVVAAAVLAVVDPRSTGLGGDAFALHWTRDSDAPIGFAAAGPAPAGLSVDALRRAGFEDMPEDGAWTVTVPGVVAGWERFLDRLGTVDLRRALAPAIAIAEDGFAVTPTIARDWSDSVDKLQRHPYSASVYLPEGRPPKEGERMTNPDLAAALRAVAEEGSGVFYRGWIAERIEDGVRGAGGPLRATDLARWPGPRWVTPISARFRDVDVFELPPPNQGLVTLQALGLYARIPQASAADEEHAAIESLKLAFSDAERFVCDPDVRSVPVAGLLADRYLEERSALVDMAKAAEAQAGSPGDTVYVAVMKDGEGCSFIQSVFAGFGSGVGAPGTGIVLQNRGAGLSSRRATPIGPREANAHTTPSSPPCWARMGSCAGVSAWSAASCSPRDSCRCCATSWTGGTAPRRRCRGLASACSGLGALRSSAASTSACWKSSPTGVTKPKT